MYAFKKNTEVAIKRMKSRTYLRDKYDRLKKLRLENAVLRYNRNNIYESLLLMEGTIYKEQKKLVDHLNEKDEKREENIAEQIEKAYSSFKEYKKVKDKEIFALGASYKTFQYVWAQKSFTNLKASALLINLGNQGGDPSINDGSTYFQQTIGGRVSYKKDALTANAAARGGSGDRGHPR